MANQLASGKWMATQRTSSGTKMRQFDTKEEADEFEQG